jgi:hypothetical protein
MKLVWLKKEANVAVLQSKRWNDFRKMILEGEKVD